MCLHFLLPRRSKISPLAALHKFGNRINFAPKWPTNDVWIASHQIESDLGVFLIFVVKTFPLLRSSVIFLTLVRLSLGNSRPGLLRLHVLIYCVVGIAVNRDVRGGSNVHFFFFPINLRPPGPSHDSPPTPSTKQRRGMTHLAGSRL